MAKLTIRNDSGATLYLEDFGHQELLDGAQTTLNGSRNRFIDATQLETLINDSDVVVIDARGDDMNTYQAQHLRQGPSDDQVQEEAALRVVIYGKADGDSPSPTFMKGTPVHISDYDTVNDEYTFTLADSDTAAFPAIGVVNGDTITTTQGGHVVVIGRIGRLDTSSWTVGDPLYVSPTGTLTNTKPTGAAIKVQKVAQVLYSHATDGVIMVIGAGRANDIPNITSGKVWMGNGSDVPTETDVYTEAEADALFSNRDKMCVAYNGDVVQSFQSTMVALHLEDSGRCDTDYYTHHHDSGEIEVVYTGWYLIMGGTTIEATSTSRNTSKVELRVDGEEILGSQAYGFHYADQSRQTISARGVISLTAGQKVSICMGRDTGKSTLQTIEYACRLTLIKMDDTNE